MAIDPFDIQSVVTNKVTIGQEDWNTRAVLALEGGILGDVDYPHVFGLSRAQQLRKVPQQLLA
jgi:hypothetical protein